MPDAVLVEKILRVQPDVHKIYLVVRAIDEASAKQRVQQEVRPGRAHIYTPYYMQALASYLVFFILTLHAHTTHPLG
jgi:hypothetical protein